MRLTLISLPVIIFALGYLFTTVVLEDTTRHLADRLPFIRDEVRGKSVFTKVQTFLSDSFGDVPDIPRRQSNPTDVPTGPPNFPTQCTTLWLKTIHLYGVQGFDENKELKCCDLGCVTNLARAEFCPAHERNEALQVEVVDSALNGVPSRECKNRNWVAEAATAGVIPHTFVDDCFWTVDCTYSIVCKADNNTYQG